MSVHAVRSLSLSSGLGLNYSASASSFPLFHRLRLTAGFLGFSVPLSLPCLSPSSRPGFPCLLPGSKYSAFCLFPFVLPCFAPTAVPQVLPFWFSPRGPTLGFRSLSIPSALASHYSAFRSSFPDFPRSPHGWLPGYSVSPLGSPAFFRLSCLVSHAFSSVLQYSALCLFPFILPCFAPTAVPQVLTFFRLSTSLRCFPCDSLPFVRFSFRFLTTQPSVSSVPFSPAFPHSGSFRCCLCLSASADPLSLRPVSMPSLQLWYLALLQFPFPLYCSRLTGASAVSGLLLSEHGRPHSFRLRFGYLGRVMYPEN